MFKQVAEQRKPSVTHMAVFLFLLGLTSEVAEMKSDQTHPRVFLRIDSLLVSFFKAKPKVNRSILEFPYCETHPYGSLSTCLKAAEHGYLD